MGGNVFLVVISLVLAAVLIGIMVGLIKRRNKKYEHFDESDRNR